MAFFSLTFFARSELYELAVRDVIITFEVQAIEVPVEDGSEFTAAMQASLASARAMRA